MKLDKNIFLKSIAISLIIISFFLGYFLRENASGGGLEFYNLSWPIIQSFRADFFFTIENYSSYGDGTIPFSHIINAYLNPFSNNDSNFQLSITVISFIIFLIFSLVMKKVFFKAYFVDILLISSTILLLPFFRTSAFWGKNENFGWLFFILALYFFSEIKKNISRNSNNNEILNVVFFCLTSSCALYARQALIFLPISYFLYLFFNKASKKIIIISIALFIIFVIPGLSLILFWREIYEVQNVLLPIGFNKDWLHPKYILFNIPILLSFFGFYLLPILIIEFFEVEKKIFFKRYYKSFLSALAIFIFLFYLGILDYLGNYTIGGGAILKLNYLIEKNNFILLLIFASFGFSLLWRFLKEDLISNAVIIFPMFIVYCFTHLLYQEYVEPLILLMFFLVLKTHLQKIYFNNVSFSNLIFISYFAIYLLGTIYFKHFAFNTFEEWKIFLN